MKILNRLTIKHLSMNKKRTLVTIIGIVLSTALMVGLGLLVSTFVVAMRQDAEKYSGTYHAYFENVTQKEKQELNLNVNFKNTYSYGIVGFTKIESSNKYKPYLYIVSGDDEYLNHLTIIEGRLPENSNEIVLSNHFTMTTEKYKIGDTIELDIGKRIIEQEEVLSNNIAIMTNNLNSYNTIEELEILEDIKVEKKRTYKIVGIASRNVDDYYSAPGYMAFTKEESDVYNYRVYTEYKNVKKTYELTSEICNQLNEATCKTNDSLLYYYGVSRYSNITNSIVAALTIALSLISIGAIIVIYNSFAISTMERKKSFGLYSSLGATPKQIKYTVFFEAFVVGIIGIILGLLGAFLGIYILIQVLNYLIGDTYGINLVLTIEPLFIIIPIIFMILVIYFSAFIPAKKASRVSSVELIRENDEIKIPRRKVKTPKWIRKLFGMEGEIALKNIKRNKRKYRITLLSLFISIVLFISFSTYLNIGLSVVDINDIPDYDIYASTSKKEMAEEIANFDSVKKAYISSFVSGYAKIIDEKVYQKDFYNYLKKQELEALPITFVILNEEDYNEIRTKLNIKSQSPILYNHQDYVFYTTSERMAYSTEIFKEVPTNLEVCLEAEKCQNISIESTTNKTGIINSIVASRADSTYLFLSEDMYNNLNIKTDIEYYDVYIYSDNYKQLYETLDKKYNSTSYTVSDIYIYSPKLELQERKNTILAMKILFYGFITLVTLIGITSVFNTIYTSIHLRRKEFAMLRSIGLTPKGFNKMLFFESFFFGIKSLFYALPVSFALIYLINESTNNIYNFGQLQIPWTSIIIAIIGVFILILTTMLYSARKIKKENILTSLRDENI